MIMLLINDIREGIIHVSYCSCSGPFLAHRVRRTMAGFGSLRPSVAWLWRSHPDHRPGYAEADKSPSAPLALVEALLLRPLMNDLQSRA
jgi:hypothetical protein